MSSSEDLGSGSHGEKSTIEDQDGWVGVSSDSFMVEELDEAVEERETRWRQKADIEVEEGDEWQNVRLRLDSDDVERNSDFSGDRNGLHEHPDIVAEAIERYHDQMFPPKEQEDGQPVVLAQGMNYIDALADQLDRPLQNIGGRWWQMVYVAENDDGVSDEVLMSGNPEEGYDAMVIPNGSVADRKSSGRIEADFFRKGKNLYHEDHNEYLTALADLAVGRGRQTSEIIRNGELLLNNRIDVNGPVDWDDIDSFSFERSSSEVLDEENNVIQCIWEIEADKGGGWEKLGEYSEEFLYADGFEEMETVQRYRDQESSPLDLYRDAGVAMSYGNLPAAAWAAGTANLKASSQLFDSMITSK